MSFASEASKLLTNKYFLYFIVFLSVTNVLGYLVTNKTNAVIFFALISLLTYQFSKNMAVILLVSLIATNFLMANKRIREGLDNQESSEALNKVIETDPDIAEVAPIVKNANSTEEVQEKLKTNPVVKKPNTVAKNPNPVSKTVETALDDNNASMDINNSDLNKNVSEPNAPQGVNLTNNKKIKNEEHFGPRLDYAATIEQSYQNLDQLLGSDSIKQLTNDTQKLMAQQQNLFNTMNQMVPVLEGAKNMLGNFNIGELTKSLNGIGNLVGQPKA
jgi:uncharacterized membrane protein YciS (DUF1049 family)